MCQGCAGRKKTKEPKQIKNVTAVISEKHNTCLLRWMSEKPETNIYRFFSCFFLVLYKSKHHEVTKKLESTSCQSITHD